MIILSDTSIWARLWTLYVDSSQVPALEFYNVRYSHEYHFDKTVISLV
jgi:hypothetical protein